MPRRTPGQAELPGLETPSLAPTVAQEKLLDAAVEIYGSDPTDLRYLHVILAQCRLPYRELPEATPFYKKRNGRTSIILTPGVLLDPKTRRPALQGIPYGAKPRLLMIHLYTQAKLTRSPVVEIGGSMSAFMADLGLAVTGEHAHMMKDRR